MKKEAICALKELTEIPGISGCEQQVSAYLAKGLMDLDAEILRDGLGNLIVNNIGERPYRVGVYAHMDEIGLIVKHISRFGQVFFDLVGNMDERILLASEWFVITEDGRAIPAVIGNKSRHLQSSADSLGAINANDLFLDVGAATDQEVRELGISVGCQVVFGTKAEMLGYGQIKAKALDNRVSCHILSECLRTTYSALRQMKLFGFFTAQEEIGARGARVVGHGKQLNMIITLDTVPVQNPGAVEEGLVSLGRGPVIRLRDYHPSTKLGMISHPKLIERLEKVAKDNNIPYQKDILTGTYLDSSTAHLTDGGIPGISICIPRRYAHTPVEICSCADIENTLQLLNRFIMSLDEEPILFENRYK